MVGFLGRVDRSPRLTVAFGHRGATTFAHPGDEIAEVAVDLDVDSDDRRSIRRRSCCVRLATDRAGANCRWISVEAEACVGNRSRGKISVHRHHDSTCNHRAIASVSSSLQIGFITSTRLAVAVTKFRSVRVGTVSLSPVQIVIGRLRAGRHGNRYAPEVAAGVRTIRAATSDIRAIDGCIVVGCTTSWRDLVAMMILYCRSNGVVVASLL